MSVTLDAVPTSATANAYADEAYATAYFEARLRATEWQSAPTLTRLAALIQATQLLDLYVDWNGARASASQPLAWPRSDVEVKDTDDVTFAINIFPDFLKKATCEMALALLQSDLLKDPRTGLASLSVTGGVSMVFSRSDRKEVIPDMVSMLIRGYGYISRRNGGIIRLSRG